MNININKDDPSINNFLYIWDSLKEKPSKYTINILVDPELFDKWLLESEAILKSCDSDYLPSKDEEGVLNQKKLYQIKKPKSLYISFTHYDSLTDDSIIGDICVYHKSGDDELVNEILEKLLEIEIDPDEIEGDDENNENPKVYTLSSSNGSLDAEMLELPEKDFTNIELYYNDGVVKKVNKMLKSFNESTKGIGLIYGPRGCGKTNLINYIISNSKRKVIIIPICFLDFITNPEFRNIAKKLPDTLFIIDDSEVFISDLNTKSNIYITNLLQLVDGIQSDKYPLNILCVSNLDHIDEFDPSILECNNLISCIECGPLENSKAKKLCESLGKKFKSKDEYMNLSDVLNKRKIKGEKKEMGF
jgi:hypothetical protein